MHLWKRAQNFCIVIITSRSPVALHINCSVRWAATFTGITLPAHLADKLLEHDLPFCSFVYTHPFCAECR